MNEATQPREGMRALATDRQAAAGPRVHWRAPVRDRIHRAARRGYPHEVCGLLLGRHLDDGVLVERAVRVPNRSPDRRADRYVLDPLGFLRFERLAEGRGLEVVGIWHTHPDSPARPSPTDLEWAWPGLSYLIVPVHDGRPGEWRAWWLPGDDDDPEFHELTMQEVPK